MYFYNQATSLKAYDFTGYYAKTSALFENGQSKIY